MLKYTKEIIINPHLKCGYYKFIDKDHPLHYKSDNTVYLHRHIASLSIGRWLNTDECVHHIDENKLNNNISNLEILSRSEHASIHNPNIKFDKDTKRSKIVVYCTYCGEEFNYLPNSKALYCSQKCAHSDTVKDKSITKEILDTLIPLYSWTELGPMFGYNDNGIKKRAKALGCDITRAKYKHKGTVM